MTEVEESGGTRLFVYGTLRSGGSAGGLLQGCRLEGRRCLRGTLYDVNGAFPALVLDGEGTVEGEVWSCPPGLLPALDRYEGVEEGLFQRVLTNVDGVECWIYVAGPSLRQRLHRGQVVPNGRWAPRAR